MFNICGRQISGLGFALTYSKMMDPDLDPLRNQCGSTTLPKRDSSELLSDSLKLLLLKDCAALCDCFQASFLPRLGGHWTMDSYLQVHITPYSQSSYLSPI